MLIAFLAIVTRTTWHLEGLNSMSQWDSHNDSLSRLFCSTVPSPKPPIVRYTAVSSARSRTCDDSFSGRLFMKTRNRIGPKTEPCGTPELTGTDPDSSPSITTVCDLLPRKAQIQDSAFPLIPYWWSFQMSFELSVLITFLAVVSVSFCRCIILNGLSTGADNRALVIR